MSINARFYKFTKTVDSTERPSGNGTVFAITLKDAVSVVAPVIELSTDAFDFNYCYIPSFGRYYFVQRCIILNNNRMEYHLTVDVLATYRTEILASSLYVLRSASSYNNYLIDDTWTHTTAFTESVQSTSFPDFDGQGCYLVTVINSVSQITANPASCMYVLGTSAMASLMAEMFDLDNWSSRGYDDLTASYFNPAQYITSCRWIPFGYNNIVNAQSSSTAQKVKYGWYEAESASGVLVNRYGKTVTFSISVGPYNDWTDRSADWTRYALYVPGFGVTEIDPQFSGATLSGKISIDFNTCNANLMLTNSASGKIVSQLSGKIGADVAINQVGGSIDIPTSVGGLISKGIQFGGGLAARGGFGKIKDFAVSFLQTTSLSGLLSGTPAENMENLINSGQDIAGAAADSAKQTIMNPTVSTSGADGARYTLTDNNTIYLYRRKFTHYNPAVAQLGGMCCQVKTLSTLSGYTQVANGLIEMAGTMEERNAIASLLEGGFIIA